MFNATLKSLLSRKLRLLLSGLAVVLGVMSVSGALFLTDSLGRSFDALFQTIDSNIDGRSTPGLTSTPTRRAAEYSPFRSLQPSLTVWRRYQV